MISTKEKRIRILDTNLKLWNRWKRKYFIRINDTIDLQGADLQGADLRGADLRGADLQGANFQNANLRLADLKQANLRLADLRGADLRGTNLQDADLRGTNLQDADLRGANLQGANLQDADLRGANLRGTNLQDADLRGADLRGTDLSKAFTERTIIDIETQVTGTIFKRSFYSCQNESFIDWLLENGAILLNSNGTVFNRSREILSAPPTENNEQQIIRSHMYTERTPYTYRIEDSEEYECEYAGTLIETKKIFNKTYNNFNDVKNILLTELKKKFNERTVKLKEIRNFLKDNEINVITPVKEYGGSINNWIRKNFKTNKKGYYNFNKIEEIDKNFDYIIECINEHMTFGVEIEFASSICGEKINEILTYSDLNAPVEGNGGEWSNHGRNINYENWNITYDSSITIDSNFDKEIEIVSPILKGKEGIKELQKVLRKLKTMENDNIIQINKSCGLHIHIGDTRGNMKELQLYNLLSIYAKNESIIDNIMPNSRRGNNNNYCKAITIKHFFDSQNNINSESRNKKINLQHFATRGTIEFRHHSGSVDFEKIGNWILFLQHTITAAGAFTSFNNKKYTNIMEYCNAILLPEETIDYYKKRFCELNPNKILIA